MIIKTILAMSVLGMATYGIGNAQTMYVKGKVNGSNNDVIRFIKYDGNQPVKQDSIKIINGSINGSIEVAQLPEKMIMYLGRYGRWIWVEPGTMTIDGQSDDIYKLNVGGTKAQDESNVYDTMLRNKTAKIEGLSELQRQASTAEGRQKLQQVYAPMRNEAEDIFIKEHPDSYFSLDIVSNSNRKHEDIVKLFNSLNEEVKSSPIGQKVAESLDISGRSANGQTIIDFSRKDINGKDISIQSFRGKYVLVDFWASWCVPCRAENPHVLAAYKKFKDRGFTVLSVSIDDSPEKWKRAIEEDGLPWTHVRDRENKKSELLDYYGIMGVPTTFLLDPNGVIIAQNLRGDALEKKLNEIFGQGTDK